MALSPDDYINLLLLLSLLFPTNSHQLNPTNSRLCVWPHADVCADKKSPILLFFYSPNILLPPNFFQEASCLHLSLEWMCRRLSTVRGNGGNERKTTKQVTKHCVFTVFALCRNMTVYYKGIEYKKDDGPCRGVYPHLRPWSKTPLPPDPSPPYFPLPLLSPVFSSSF